MPRFDDEDEHHFEYEDDNFLLKMAGIILFFTIAVNIYFHFPKWPSPGPVAEQWKLDAAVILARETEISSIRETYCWTRIPEPSLTPTRTMTVTRTPSVTRTPTSTFASWDKAEKEN